MNIHEQLTILLKELNFIKIVMIKKKFMEYFVPICTLIPNGFLPNVPAQFQNLEIPLADSNLRLIVTLELSNEIEGF